MNATKDSRDDFLPHLRGNTFISQSVLQSKHRALYISIIHTSQMTQHIVITQRWKQDQSACFMTRGSISSRSHMSSLEPPRAKPLWGVTQVNGRVGVCQEESGLYPSSLVRVYMCMCWAAVPASACVFASQPNCQQKCWISVSSATLPAPKDSPGTQALRQQQCHVP